METNTHISSPNGWVLRVEIKEIPHTHDPHPNSLEMVIGEFDFLLTLEDDGFIYLENMEIGGKICLGSVFHLVQEANER